ncbi:hypothetical protein A2774_04910 [Candidatus Roizmanbacteria bacterium RIFCSPHIGHO2_01_FULL_39_12c]|uniref:Dihydroorotate dehydrogenase catalytic domain-containing protein n=1 Tax=Candidatus Roizmanbacteria bacterium RIFCSPHIGHO2_01_FULL_39_12c TaxID=1802031 RepID=A0A1F7GE18_9BACT|nr:MAG: hypothetical protein A2774_04910 [Candidatus Roizmanbacteria bacterium RIFCSPHIGHO2_01_FULL_39_12c]OGK46898.1 MAG: hypothetical protein A2963_05060 [Candidatus Roizmanbacteria bacterium RIFCSPLOWO2_01_FULL_40_13]
MDTSTSIKNLIFDFPVMNASGIWGATENELKKILESKSGAAVVKSVTLTKRSGNPGVRYYKEEVGSINSMGLPNQGIEYYCDIADRLNEYRKPVILSLAGFSQNDYIKLVRKASKYSFSALEVNLSCPNIEGKGIFAYDFKTMFKLLKKLRKLTDMTMGVKLSPYAQRDEIKLVAENLLDIRIDFVTTMNTFPLSAFINWEKESTRIKPNGGIGGLGGAAVKPICLSQVILLHQYSKGKLPIIGVGGISTASDIYEFILAGAAAVQLGTSLLHNGTNFFQTLRDDLIKLLLEKKVNKLSSKIGKLKFL